MLKSTRTYIFTLSFLLLLVGYTSHAQTNTPAKKETKEKSDQNDTTSNNPPVMGDIFKPTIGLGVGNLSFFGDLYTKHFQSPTVSRFGYELNISQPLNEYLHLNFYVMFGKLGANERTPTRNENFESTIRLGGVQLLYDFSNFIKKDRFIRPYILTGFEGFEFLSKTDLKDKFGNTYYYWSDGSIKNMPQGSPGSQNAINLVRDYTYDSDIRELNRDGFGKYQERSWAIPVGAGFIMNVGERIKFRFGATMHFTFTDYIDGITSKSVGNRKGNSANDKFMLMSTSLHYDLVIKKQDKTFDTLRNDYFDNIDWLAIDKGDEDGDGVLDFDDMCHGTPAGVKVDAKGCPLDDDKDCIPDYRDDEPLTPATMLANGRGVGITDEMAQKMYDNYYDSLGTGTGRIVDLDSAKGKPKYGNPSRLPKVYTVELARYKGGIPSDEMAYLLSIGDVKSFVMGDETIFYTAGEYKDVRMALQRKDEFLAEGLIKTARVGYFKGETYFSMTEEDVKKEVDAANKKDILEDHPVVTNNNNSAQSKDQVTYRVQLGAYKNKLSPSMFKKAGNILEMKTEDGFYRYCSGGYKTINDAAVHRAELVLEGYSDVFITAYKNGKRIPLNQAGATYENEDKNYKEDITESKQPVSTIDKSLVNFKIQIGVLKKTNDALFEERIKDIKDISKQTTPSGLIRFMVGDFKTYNEAVKFKASLVEQGFPDAFVIAVFNGEVISIQEALELLK